jgi:hypothetical protein
MYPVMLSTPSGPTLHTIGGPPWLAVRPRDEAAPRASSGWHTGELLRTPFLGNFALLAFSTHTGGQRLLPDPDRVRKVGTEEPAPAAEGELVHSFRNLGNLSMGVACVLGPLAYGRPSPPVRRRRSEMRRGKWAEGCRKAPTCAARVAVHPRGRNPFSFPPSSCDWRAGLHPSILIPRPAPSPAAPHCPPDARGWPEGLRVVSDGRILGINGRGPRLPCRPAC